MNWTAVLNFLKQPILLAVFKVVIIAVIGTLLIRIVNRTLKKILENSKLEKAAHSLIRTLVKTVLYVLLALVLALSSTGIMPLPVQRSSTLSPYLTDAKSESRPLSVLFRRH